MKVWQENTASALTDTFSEEGPDKSEIASSNVDIESIDQVMSIQHESEVYEQILCTRFSVT